MIKRLHRSTSRDLKNPATAIDPVILDTIRGWKWFAYVPPEAQEWLANHASLKEIKKDTVVFSSGDPVKYLYGVVSGNFRIFFTTNNGDQIHLEDVAAGSWFVHWKQTKDLRYIVSCECHRDSLVVAIDQNHLADFATQWPGFYRGMYEELVDRSEIVFGRIELLSLHTLDVRMAVYLLRHMHLRTKKESKDEIFLDMRISQTELASRVGATRQHVNALITKWKKRGLINPVGTGIFILDVNALKAEARKTGFDLSGYLSAWQGGWQEKK